jgi:hypothetical protein
MDSILIMGGDETDDALSKQATPTFSSSIMSSGLVMTMTSLWMTLLQLWLSSASVDAAAA